MKIGLDIMGGDHAPHSTLHGALLASKQLSTDEKIVLIGDSRVAKEILQKIMLIYLYLNSYMLMIK